MTYDVLAVFENGEENYPLYPSLNNDIVIVPEAGDGPLGQALRVTKVIVRRKVGNGYKKVTETKDIAFDVWVTDSRVILYCKKFEKGGGWVGFGLGGLAVAAVANSVSMAVAASRRKGKALVGNVRYPWISSVMFAPRNGFGTEEQLRLCFVDGTDSSRPDCDVTLYLARGSDSNRIARTIVDRIIAARYASGEEMDADELARFEALRSSGLASPPQKGSLAPYKIPTSWECARRLGADVGVAVGGRSDPLLREARGRHQLHAGSGVSRRRCSDQRDYVLTPNRDVLRKLWLGRGGRELLHRLRGCDQCPGVLAARRTPSRSGGPNRPLRQRPRSG
jgi:hypothetical protein